MAPLCRGLGSFTLSPEKKNILDRLVFQNFCSPDWFREPLKALWTNVVKLTYQASMLRLAKDKPQWNSTL
jgi:hypothetical protein